MKNVKKPILSLLLVVCFCVASFGYAQASPEYPPHEDGHIIDPHQHLQDSSKRLHEQRLENLPRTYQIVFIGEQEEEGHTYAQQLFDFYDLDDESVLFVIEVDKQYQLTYALGPAVEAKGLTDDIMNQKMEDHYLPSVRDGEPLSGVSMFIQSIEKELEDLRNAREQEARVAVTDDNTPTEETNDASLPWWMWVLITLIGALFVFFIVSYVYRRRLIHLVDDLERWKMTLENRPFSEELSKIKGLKLSGETESRFDQWKEEWDQLMMNTLPDIEEILIDIEDDAYSYHFIRAKHKVNEARHKLQDIEETFTRIMDEVQALTTSEQQNREKITKLHEQYQKIKMGLTQNSVRMGISLPYWDEKFKKAHDWFLQFQSAQDNGDVLTANEYAQAIEEIFAELLDAVERTPAYIQQIEEVLPQTLKELELNIQDMVEKGYHISTEVQEMLSHLKKSKTEVISYMEKGQLNEMRDWIVTQEECIEQIYEQLEEDVHLRQTIMSKCQTLSDDMEKKYAAYQSLDKDIHKTKDSYAWDKEWQEQETKLDQIWENMVNHYTDIIETEAPEKHYLQLKPKIESFRELEEAFDQHFMALRDIIETVREEEMNARGQSAELKQTLIRLVSALRKSNIPGIPEHVNTGLTMAEEVVEELQAQFEQTPLDMGKINHLLQEASNQVASVTQVTQTVIKQAMQSEQLIQYANRYRRQYPQVVEILEEAEARFRTYQYSESLEMVESALNEIDPEWQEKIEWEEKTG
ncbi:septation ring formation regulator EzrA [Caldalkalibacillus salinus]|uniref:septation ring formation regulator EzrA n=1 Tax=Caldalkalibacillus salinus TaxID=2803787 RepID=UPI001922B66D|nr:septation ring formation regulator EzrA [Caldalkalibacillus salinus]